ncbi:MAG: phage tail tape measure protein, partial [Nanoarchaeota archaeon]
KALNGLNVLLNLNSTELRKFAGTLANIAKDTGKTFKTIIEGATELSRQGLGVTETLKRIRDAAILSRQGNLELNESIDTITAALNSFNKTALNSTEIINKFANVDAAFAVSSADLAEGLKRVGSTAASSSISIDELIALITSLQQTTARGGAVIGNGLKTILTRIERPQVLGQLEQTGVAVKDLQGNLLPTIDVLRNFSKRFEEVSQSQQSFLAETVGSVFQINLLKALVGDLSKEFSVFDSALLTSTESFDEAIKRNEEFNKSLSAALNRTKVIFTELGKGIGDITLAPVLISFTKGLEFTFQDLLDTGEEFGDTFGESVAKGLGSGIANFAKGPGLILLSFIFAKLATSFAGFSLKAAKDFLGLNLQAEKQAEVQARIQNLLANDPVLREASIKKGFSQIEIEENLLNLVRQRLLAEERLAAIAGKASKTFLATGALNIDKEGRLSLAKKRNAAKGLIPMIPNFINGSTALSEIGGAFEGGYTPGRIKQTFVKGMGQVIYNSAEQVKDFGFDQPAIIPPKNSKAGRNFQKEFKNIHGFDPFGSVLNIAAEGNIPKSKSLGGQTKEISNLMLKELGRPTVYSEEAAKQTGIKLRRTDRPKDKNLIKITDKTDLTGLFSSLPEISSELEGLEDAIKEGDKRAQRKIIKNATKKVKRKLNQLGIFGIETKIKDKDDISRSVIIDTRENNVAFGGLVPKPKFYAGGGFPLIGRGQISKVFDVGQGMVAKQFFPDREAMRQVGLSEARVEGIFGSTQYGLDFLGELTNRANVQSKINPNIIKPSFNVARPIRPERIDPRLLAKIYSELGNKVMLQQRFFGAKPSQEQADLIQNQANEILRQAKIGKINFPYKNPLNLVNYFDDIKPDNVIGNTVIDLLLHEKSKGLIPNFVDNPFQDSFGISGKQFPSNILGIKGALKDPKKFFSQLPFRAIAGGGGTILGALFRRSKNRYIRGKGEAITNASRFLLGLGGERTIKLTKKEINSFISTDQLEGLSDKEFKNIDTVVGGLFNAVGIFQGKLHKGKLIGRDVFDFDNSLNFIQELEGDSGRKESKSFNFAIPGTEKIFDKLNVFKTKILNKQKATNPLFKKGLTKIEKILQKLEPSFDKGFNLHKIKFGPVSAVFTGSDISLRGNDLDFDQYGSPFLTKIQEVNKGLVPNFAKILGKGAYGNFFDLEKKFKGIEIGKKTFKPSVGSSEITNEFIVAKELENIKKEGLLPNLLDVPKTIGTLDRSIKKGRIGKQVVRGKTGYQFANSLNLPSENSFALKDLLDDEFRAYTNKKLTPLGIIPEDLHSNNYIINQIAEQELKKLALNSKGLKKIVRGNRGNITEKYFEYLGKKGAKFTIIDPGLFRNYLTKSNIKPLESGTSLFNSRLVPNFVHNFIDPFLYDSPKDIGLNKDFFTSLFEQLDEEKSIQKASKLLGRKIPFTLASQPTLKKRLTSPNIEKIRGAFKSFMGSSEIFLNPETISKESFSPENFTELTRNTLLHETGHLFDFEKGQKLNRLFLSGNEGFIKAILKDKKTFGKTISQLTNISPQGPLAAENFAELFNLSTRGAKVPFGSSELDLDFFDSFQVFRDLIKAKGHIPKFSQLVPNFNALGDAFNREKSAGISRSMIKLGKDKRLASSFNPFGLGVYNTKDEPLGLSQGINRVANRGMNPKLSGIVPNFVEFREFTRDPSQAKGRASIINQGEILVQQAIFNHLENLKQAVREGVLKQEQFNSVIVEATTIFGLTKESANRMKKSLDLTARNVGGFNRISEGFSQKVSSIQATVVLPASKQPIQEGISQRVLAVSPVLNRNIQEGFSQRIGGIPSLVRNPLDPIGLGSSEPIASTIASLKKQEQERSVRLRAFSEPGNLNIITEGIGLTNTQFIDKLKESFSKGVSGFFNEVSKIDVKNLTKEQALKIQSFANIDTRFAKLNKQTETQLEKDIIAVQDSFLGLGKNAREATKRLADRNPEVLRRAQRSRRQNPALLQGALIASFTAPLIAGLVQEAIPQDTRTGRGFGAIAGGLGNIASFTALGASIGGGLPGIAIGGALGLALEIPKVIRAFTDELPDLQKAFENLRSQNARVSESLQTLVVTQQQLQDAYLGVSNVSIDTIQNLLEAQREALSNVPTGERRKLREEIQTTGGFSKTISEINRSRKREENVTQTLLGLKGIEETFTSLSGSILGKEPTSKFFEDKSFNQAELLRERLENRKSIDLLGEKLVGRGNLFLEKQQIQDTQPIGPLKFSKTFEKEFESANVFGLIERELLKGDKEIGRLREISKTTDVQTFLKNLNDVFAGRAKIDDIKKNIDIFVDSLNSVAPDNVELKKLADGFGNILKRFEENAPSVTLELLRRGADRFFGGENIKIIESLFQQQKQVNIALDNFSDILGKTSNILSRFEANLERFSENLLVSRGEQVKTIGVAENSVLNLLNQNAGPRTLARLKAQGNIGEIRRGVDERDLASRLGFQGDISKALTSASQRFLDQAFSLTQGEGRRSGLDIRGIQERSQGFLNQIGLNKFIENLVPGDIAGTLSDLSKLIENIESTRLENIKELETSGTRDAFTNLIKDFTTAIPLQVTAATGKFVGRQEQGAIREFEELRRATISLKEEFERIRQDELANFAGGIEAVGNRTQRINTFFDNLTKGNIGRTTGDTDLQTKSLIAISSQLNELGLSEVFRGDIISGIRSGIEEEIRSLSSVIPGLREKIQKSGFNLDEVALEQFNRRFRPEDTNKTLIEEQRKIFGDFSQRFDGQTKVLVSSLDNLELTVKNLANSGVRISNINEINKALQDALSIEDLSDILNEEPTKGKTQLRNFFSDVFTKDILKSDVSQELIGVLKNQLLGKGSENFFQRMTNVFKSLDFGINQSVDQKLFENIFDVFPDISKPISALELELGKQAALISRFDKDIKDKRKIGQYKTLSESIRESITARLGQINQTQKPLVSRITKLEKPIPILEKSTPVLDTGIKTLTTRITQLQKLEPQLDLQQTQVRGGAIIGKESRERISRNLEKVERALSLRKPAVQEPFENVFDVFPDLSKPISSLELELGKQAAIISRLNKNIEDRGKIGQETTGILQNKTLSESIKQSITTRIGQINQPRDFQLRAIEILNNEILTLGNSSENLLRTAFNFKKAIEETNQSLIDGQLNLDQANNRLDLIRRRAILDSERQSGLIFSEDAAREAQDIRVRSILDPQFKAKSVPGAAFGAFADTLAFGKEDFFKGIIEGAADVGLTMKREFAAGFKSFIDGTKNAEDALRDFGLSVLDRILDITSQISTNILFGGIGKLLSFVPQSSGTLGGLTKTGG